MQTSKYYQNLLGGGRGLPAKPHLQPIGGGRVVVVPSTCANLNALAAQYRREQDARAQR